MVSSHLPKNDPFSPTPTLTQAASCGCCFPFFLLPPSPFFIFKENSRSAEGAQLRPGSGRPARSARRHRFSEPLPGEGWAAGHIQKLPRHQRGAWSGASRCNSRHLARRRNTPALIPNSQNHVSIQTPDADTVATTVFPTARPLSSSHAPTWGPCPALPFPRLG